MKISSLILKAHMKQAAPKQIEPPASVAPTTPVSPVTQSQGESETPATTTESVAKVAPIESTVSPSSEPSASTPTSVPAKSSLSVAEMIHQRQVDEMVGEEQFSVERIEEIETIEGYASSSPEDFKGRLDKLDALIATDVGLDIYTVDIIRAHVKRIMIDLKEQPELDAVLIDRDVHNVLHFVRFVKEVAVEKVVKKVEKKTVKANKGGLGSFSMDLTNLPASLQGLGGLKT